jgi:CubicO group peptidase (beta-lactamase class C family)
LAAALAIAGCGGPQIEINGQPQLQAAVDAFIEPYLGGRNFSGAVLITSGNQVLADSAYGNSDWIHVVANSSQTRFQIGSISKTFTAASILLLVERGLLELDDPVARYLEEFPNGEEITVHHLLTHTSGLPRFVFQADYRERSMRHHTASDLVSWIRELPLGSGPGARAAYSNANYAALAAIVEEVSGQDYSAFLEKEIFEPLDLRSTGLARSAGLVVTGLASGYHPVGRSEIENALFHDYTSAIGAGAIFSTTGDLDSWLRLLKDGVLLSRGSLEKLFSRDADTETYAWRLTEFDGHPAVSAQGWDGVGFSGKILHLEDLNLTVVVLCNLNISGISSEIAENLAMIALGKQPQALHIETEPADVDELNMLAGTYRFGPEFYVPNTTIEFAVSDGEMVVEGFQPGALLRLADGSFVHRQHWFRVAFERDGEGRVSGIQYGRFQATRESTG